MGQIVNALKVAINDLRTYLGADKKGCELLSEVDRLATAQRKRAASLEDAAAASAEFTKTMRPKIDALESEVASLRAALSREAARRSASETRERALLAQLTPETNPDEAAELNEVADDNLCTLLTKVRHRFKKLPHRKWSGVVVEDFIKDFSYDEFAGLGMAMAACALCNVPLTLRSERPLGRSLDEKHKERFFRWFRDAIAPEPKWRDELFVRTDSRIPGQ